MATTYADVPQEGQFREDLQFVVLEDDAVVESQVVAFDSTPGFITSTTTATSGMAAGFAGEDVSATATDYSGTAAPPYVRIPIQFHGTTRFIAGAAITYGAQLVLDGTDGRLIDRAATAATVFMTHAIALDDPDTDGDYGHALINLNVPHTTPAA